MCTTVVAAGQLPCYVRSTSHFSELLLEKASEVTNFDCMKEAVQHKCKGFVIPSNEYTMAASQENRTLIACTIAGLKPTAQDHLCYEKPLSITIGGISDLKIEDM